MMHGQTKIKETSRVEVLIGADQVAVVCNHVSCVGRFSAVPLYRRYSDDDHLLPKHVGCSKLISF